MTGNATHIETVSHHPLLEASPAAWQQLVPHMALRSCARDDVLLRHGDAAGYLWLVYEGWIKLTRQTPDGKETVLGLCTAGDVFGEAALFEGATYPYQAIVIGGNACIATVPARQIQATAKHIPGFSAALLSMLNEHNNQTQLRLEHASTMSSTQRLGCFLLRLCRQDTGQARSLQIPVEKHILASYLGMKPETLSRSQQQLKALGVEVNGASVTIDDMAKLRHFVCGSCSESGMGGCIADED